MKWIARMVAVGLLAVTATTLVAGDDAEALPYGCGATFNYGGTVGESHCSGGYGTHRSRLSCRKLSTGVVYYTYGFWSVPGVNSWSRCTDLGGPSYNWDAIGVIYQLRSY